MPLADLGLEVIESPSEEAWAVLEQGPWTFLKARRGIALDWPRAYRALHRNTPNPGLIARSDSEVSDGAELERVRAEMVVARMAGFARIIVAPANELNNTTDWDLARWQRERSNYIAQWLAFGREWAITVCSPAFKPDDPSVLAPWHEGLEVFPLKGAHVYGSWPNLFWEPGHVFDMIGGPVIVLEFNQNQEFRGDRAPANIAMLEKCIEHYPDLSLVTFFCAPNSHPEFAHMGVTLSDALEYRKWFKNQKEELMLWKDRQPDAYKQFTDEGGTPEAFESITQAWVLANGQPDEALIRYLVGTRRLRATQSRLDWLSNAGKAAFEELNQATKPYLPN